MAKFDPSLQSMLEVFLYETTTLLDQLEELLMTTEKEESIGSDEINQIFRIMHTIKGSAAMMELPNISKLAHAVEDLFFILREDPDTQYDKNELYTHLFKAFDCLKGEVDTLPDESAELTDFTEEMNEIRAYAAKIKGEEAPAAKADAKSGSSNSAAAIFDGDDFSDDKIFAAHVLFDPEDSMSNMRAMVMLRGLKKVCEVKKTIPEDPTVDDAVKALGADGLVLKYSTEDNEAVLKKIKKAVGVKGVEAIAKEKPKEAPKAEEKPKEAPKPAEKKPAAKPAGEKKAAAPADSIISVKLSKLDELLDLVSEIVITESMLTALPIMQTDENFSKPVRNLKKLTDELQDFAMSVRMLPISVAFNKMSRIVRDMNVKLGKDVDLVFKGEETEVDKTVIDALGDPLMHIVRNSMDHGIELPADREAAGKTERAKVILSAESAAGEIIIRIIDNGKGMDTQKLIAKAQKNGLLTKPPEEYTHAEALKLIMLPGFSTNEQVTEYSGRGVGMDVVRQNIEKIRGTINIKSEFGQGTEFIIKIPLTLSIIDAMQIRVGSSSLLVPTLSIKEVFKLDVRNLVSTTGSNEMIMRRDKCYPIVRLHSVFGIDTKVTDLAEGIMLMCDSDAGSICLFADELAEEVSVVIKSFPTLLNRMGVKDTGLTGCAILGDGSITLLVDVKTLCERAMKEDKHETI